MSLINKLTIMFLILTISACSSESSENDSKEGLASIKVSIPGLENNKFINKTSLGESSQAIDNASVPAEVDSIIIDVLDNRSDVLDAADILANNGEVTLNIVAGKNYTVRGRAFANNEVLFSGTSEIDSIVTGDRISVSLSLLDQIQLSLTAFANTPVGTAETDVSFNLNGLNDISINWYINGILGGNAQFGTINTAGQYTAPSILPLNTTITVTAEPVNAPSFAQSFTFQLLPAINIPPVANAGADVMVNDGITVNLNGNASTDIDGTISTYSWLRISGDFNPVLNVVNSTTVSFTSPAMQFGGAATFRLTVTDNEGATDTDDVIITVNGTDQPLLANAGPDQTVNEGDSGITLTASASTDLDNTITGYLWTQLSGTSALLSSTSAVSPTFVAPDVSIDENLVFQLTVTNDAGLQDTDTVTIRVNNTVVTTEKIYFSALSTGFNQNIWVTDGTAPGTFQLASVAVENNEFARFETLNNDLYFQGNDGVNGRKLWRTDGTLVGTELVVLDDGSVTNVDPNNFAVLGDLLLLGANTSFNGSFNIPEYISLNSTNDVITPLFNSRPTGGYGVHNNELGKMDGFIYFNDTTFTPLVSTNLYRTDGINAATSIATGFFDTRMTEFTEFNNELYFVVGQKELWKTDGTNLGTVLLKTFSGHVGYSSSSSLSGVYNGGMIVFNNQLFFVADDGQGSELWVSNGVSGNSPDTLLIKDLDNNTSTSSYPYEFRVVNGNLLFFSAEGDASTDGLWITDGTSVGTTRLRALSVGNTDSSYFTQGYDTAVPTVVNISSQDLLFFVANDGITGNELWVTDGTVGGTNLVSDINSSSHSFPAIFKAGNNKLIFSAQDDDGRAKLWQTDGTAIGTSLILDICPGCFGQGAFFRPAG